MIKLAAISIVWVLFLIGVSLFFVWLAERSKRKASQKQIKKFLHFDKYYSELEREPERNLEKKRQERIAVFGYRKLENIDVARFSNRSAV